MRSTILILLILLLLTLTAQAYWPTTVEENLIIGNSSTLNERYPTALPGTNGRTLVAYFASDYGCCYQIIDRFGELILPEYEMLTPALPLMERYGVPKSVADNEGGMFVCWASNGAGIYAQYVDSLGNRMWGDEGVRIFPFTEIWFDVCSDSQGGMWAAVIPGNGTPEATLLRVQRVDGAGNLMFSDSGHVAVRDPLAHLEYPIIAPDGAGGCFICWVRDLQGSNNSVFVQHLDGNGNTLWPQDLYICQNTYGRKIIHDGEGGFIFEANPGGDYNTHWRIDGDGNILWTRDHLSWYYWAEMVPGEPGFFYLSWNYWGVVYGQRMDIEGNNYWHISGAPMSVLPPNWSLIIEVESNFRYPYLYSTYYYEDPNQNKHLFVQALDTSGERQWGQMGCELTSVQSTNSFPYQYTNAIPDEEGGCVGVWELQMGNLHDIYAKRCNNDGTLGGPFPLSVDLAPHSPPEQIPPGGGSFFYDIAMADSDSVGGLFDAWIEVTLPNGSTLEILSRNDISVLPEDTVSRMDLEQFVPPGAPPGIYTYTAYAGNYPYQSPWGQDSFTFEKLSQSDSRQAGMTGDRLQAGMTDWLLEGFFEDKKPVRQETVGAFRETPLHMEIHPNPFNLTTTIHFTLPQAGWVDLEVFDIHGRNVGATLCGRPGSGSHGGRPLHRWNPAGTHGVTFDGSDLASGIYFVRLKTRGDYVVKKVLLMK